MPRNADLVGDWSVRVSGLSKGDYVAALATGVGNFGNTSKYSAAIIVNNATQAPDIDVPVGKIKVFNNIIRRNGTSSDISTIRWQQPHDAATTIRILNENGNLVIKLASNQWYPKDLVHILTWDSRDTSGNPVASGLYYAHIQSNDVNHFAKILVMDR